MWMYTRFTLQAKLNDMQVKVGEVDRSMSDVIATLEQLQTDIKNQGDVTGDPKHLETILRKLQVSRGKSRGGGGGKFWSLKYENYANKLNQINFNKH